MNWFYTEIKPINEMGVVVLHAPYGKMPYLDLGRFEKRKDGKMVLCTEKNDDMCMWAKTPTKDIGEMKSALCDPMERHYEYTYFMTAVSSGENNVKYMVSRYDKYNRCFTDENGKKQNVIAWEEIPNPPSEPFSKAARQRKSVQLKVKKQIARLFYEREQKQFDVTYPS